MSAGFRFDCVKDGNDAVVIDQEKEVVADESRRLRGMMVQADSVVALV